MKIPLTFRRIGLVLVCVLILVVSSVDGPRAQDRSVAELANAQYTAPDGTKLYAYLAKPAGDGPHPAVILIHEWWGLNEDIISKADALAANGYVALAVDAWRGVNTRNVPHAIWLVTTTPQERVSSDLEAALKHLTALGSVDPKRLAVMGFCYGGGQSLRFGTRHPELAATILFYGQLITDPKELSSLRGGGAVLGIFGQQDAAIPPDRVRAFEKTLADLGINHQITIYPGVGHAFANQVSAITAPGPAMDAWMETLEFLEENVRKRT